jgi:hypothetical protein
MFLKFLYFIWGYKTVERDKEKLRIETDLTYSETYVRGAIFLLLFGSALISLFLGGYSIFLFYYGASVFSVIILLFIIFKAVILPEAYFSSILGYTLQNTVDTSMPGRYRTVTLITKKSHGLFQTNVYASGTDNKARDFALHVDPKGYTDSQKLPQDSLGYGVTGRFFRVNNFLVGARPLLVLVIMVGTSIFSFFPVINIFTVLLFTYIGIHLFAVQWRGSKIINKFILLLILLCLIVNFVIAALIDFVTFVKF